MFGGGRERLDGMKKGDGWRGEMGGKRQESVDEKLPTLGEGNEGEKGLWKQITSAPGGGLLDPIGGEKIAKIKPQKPMPHTATEKNERERFRPFRKSHETEDKRPEEKALVRKEEKATESQERDYRPRKKVVDEIMKRSKERTWLGERAGHSRKG